MSSPDDFYSELGAEYDLMTRFVERLPEEKAILQSWHRRYRFTSALDAACGTGLHAVILAQLGVRTTGVDISGDMLEQARRHADETQVQIELVQADLTTLARHVTGPFDAIFCLGNSLPHLLTDEQLQAAVGSFAELLANGGVLVLQLLNYERILNRRERIVGVSTAENTYFVRFYDFLDDLLQFNILSIRDDTGKLSHRLTSTPLKPYRLPELQIVLSRNGFTRLETFGDMSFSPFDADASSNLVVVSGK